MIYQRVIIGGGLAGLSTAYFLEQQNHHADLLIEAKPHLGGRVQSVQWMGGQVEELGGKNLLDGGSAATIRNLISQFNISTEHQKTNYASFGLHQDESFDLKERYLDYFKTQHNNEPLTALQLAIANQSTHSADDVLQIIFARDFLLLENARLHLNCYEGSKPNELAKQAAHSLSFLFERFDFKTPKAYEFLSCLDGNRSIIQKLNERINLKLILGASVIGIEETQGHLNLKLSDQSIIHAQQVICTTPLPILQQKINWQIPDLIKRQQEWKKSGFGSNGKILLPLAKPLLQDAHSTSTKQRVSWLNHKKNAITLYYGQRDFKLTPEKALQEINLLKKFYKSSYFYESYDAQMLPNYAEPSLSQNTAWIKDWQQDPHTLGSYSNSGMHQKEWEASECVLGVKMRKMFRPYKNRILFAGEHTVLEDYATMEGACRSGKNAADLICAKSS